MNRRLRYLLIRVFAIVCVVVLNVNLSTTVIAQEQPSEVAKLEVAGETITDIEPNAVILDDEPLFEIGSNLGGFSPTERAEIASGKLTKIANSTQIPVTSIRAKTSQDHTVIVAGTTKLIPIVTITQQDAKTAQMTQAELANSYVAKIQRAIATYREERSVQNILRGIGYTIVATLGLIIAINLMNKLFTATLDRIKIWLEHYGNNLRESGNRLISLTPFVALFLRFAELTRNFLYLLLVCFYIFLILSFFPWTQEFSHNFWAVIAATLRGAERAIVGYVPSLLTLILIVFITREILAFTHLLFQEVKQGNISIPWFYTDWIEPTFQLVRFFLLALAIAIGLPFLPGFQSPAFQGVSLVLSALFTLGAANAVANIVGGVITVYTRAFQLRDMIKIGELTGIVVEKNLLVTRICTPKNVIITLPNSTILNSNIVNYSALAKRPSDTTGLILHTTITLGYDVPWQNVHQALIQAAQLTPHILAEPAPFVLQTALNDFHVSYELNAYTDRPDRMQFLYSDLHQNIQEQCNQAGIEILSPSYLAMRDGNHSTIPETYLPPNYQAPGFRVDRSTPN